MSSADGSQRGPRLSRDVAVSLVGSLLPAVVGVVATTLLVSSADATSAATILGVWTIVGYLSLTDLGLTRSASTLAASGAGSARTVVSSLWRTSIPLGLIGSVLVALLLSAASPVPAMWLLLAFPLLAALQFPVIGSLEAGGRFGALAIQKLLNSIFSYLLPAALAVWNPAGQGIAAGVTILVLYRLISLVALSFTARVGWRGIAAVFGRLDVRVHGVRSVVVWVGLSSVLGPLMLYADRIFLLGAGASESVWVYYVALSEILMKTYVIPSAVLAVLFPWMLKRRETHASILKKFFVGLLPPTTVLAIVAAGAVVLTVPPAALALGASGLDEQTVRQIAFILIAATIANWASQAYIALLQAYGWQRGVTTLQLVIVPVFIIAMFLAQPAGVIAIALVAAARVLVVVGGLAMMSWLVLKAR